MSTNGLKKQVTEALRRMPRGRTGMRCEQIKSVNGYSAIIIEMKNLQLSVGASIMILQYSTE